jgi:hypothetical protein
MLKVIVLSFGLLLTPIVSQVQTLTAACAYDEPRHAGQEF